MADNPQLAVIKYTTDLWLNRGCGGRVAAYVLNRLMFKLSLTLCVG
jgi:hypothetical protein